MKETYQYEFNWWQKILQKTLGMWQINRDNIEFKWGYFAPKFGLELCVHRGWYFDSQYRLSFVFGWGKFHFKLPFRVKNYEEDSEWRQYGIQSSADAIWLRTGKDFKAWDLPWFSWKFVGHWILDNDYVWQKMSYRRNDGLPNPWDFRESGDCIQEFHDYTYVLDSGEVQERKATCTIEKREWHRKWFPWIKMTRQVIDIKFSDEVGERTGSWKGGVTGTSHKMLDGETIEQCLRRMEQERKFT